MFIRKELAIIRDALELAQATKPDQFKGSRFQAVLRRSTEHVDYMCADCDGTGIDPLSRGRTDLNGKVMGVEPCDGCEGNGRSEKWHKTQRFFASPEMVTTGEEPGESLRIGERGI